MSLGGFGLMILGYYIIANTYSEVSRIGKNRMRMCVSVFE